MTFALLVWLFMCDSSQSNCSFNPVCYHRKFFFFYRRSKKKLFFWEKKKNNKKCIQIKFFWCKIHPWIFINTSIDIIIDIQYSLCPFHECLSLYETIPYIYEQNRFVRNSQHNNYNPHAKDFFDLKSSTFWSFLSLIDRFRI